MTRASARVNGLVLNKIHTESRHDHNVGKLVVIFDQLFETIFLAILFFFLFIGQKQWRGKNEKRNDICKTIF